MEYENLEKGNGILISDPDKQSFEAVFIEFSHENKIVHFRDKFGRKGNVGRRWVIKI